jgi:hypothetical protein
MDKRKDILNGNSYEILKTNSTLKKFEILGPLTDSRHAAKGYSKKYKRVSSCSTL